MFYEFDGNLINLSNINSISKVEVDRIRRKISFTITFDGKQEYKLYYIVNNGMIYETGKESTKYPINNDFMKNPIFEEFNNKRNKLVKALIEFES